MVIIKAGKAIINTRPTVTGVLSWRPSFWFQDSIPSSLFLFSSYYYKIFFQVVLKPQLIIETHHSVSPGENVDDEKGFSFGATKGFLDVWTVGWWGSAGVKEDSGWKEAFTCLCCLQLLFAGPTAFRLYFRHLPQWKCFWCENLLCILEFPTLAAFSACLAQGHRSSGFASSAKYCHPRVDGSVTASCSSVCSVCLCPLLPFFVQKMFHYIRSTSQ